MSVLPIQVAINPTLPWSKYHDTNCRNLYNIVFSGIVPGHELQDHRDGGRLQVHLRICTVSRRERHDKAEGPWSKGSAAGSIVCVCA